jgi:hypothetical protein
MVLFDPLSYDLKRVMKLTIVLLVFRTLKAKFFFQILISFVLA